MNNGSELNRRSVYMIAYTQYPLDTRVRREAEALASLKKYDVMVVAPKTEKEQKTYELNGVKVVELNTERYWRENIFAYMMCYMIFLLLAFCDCTRLALLGRIDIVHVHNMPNFLVFAATVPRLLGKKVILDIHDSVPETYAAKYNNKTNIIFKILCLEEAICCHIANRIICVNHPQKDVLVERGIPADKIWIFMNVPDDEWYRDAKTSLLSDNSDNSFQLIYHGTLAWRLGVDLTIRALSKVTDEIPGIKFHVVGRGECMEELVALANSLGLSSTVKFHSFMRIEQLILFLKDMHLGVISNRRNIATELMLPVKLLEYIAQNIPVVAPPLRALKYYFSDEMLFFYEVEDVDSLAAAILEAYRNREKLLLRAERAKSFLDEFSWQRNKQNLFDLYSSS
jgi:glycosyltransferase involved in cell wall biosynthesis